MECSDCLASVRPVAIAFAALGAAGILALTAESDIVIAVAEAASVAPEDLVQILPAIASVVGGGADAIAQAICGATGSCP